MRCKQIQTNNNKMANAFQGNPVSLFVNREQGYNGELTRNLFDTRLEVAKNLYRRDLVCHYGCVNALEFSDDGEFFVSGGDDRRVMLWKFGQTIFNKGHPQQMNNTHLSNIFCLAITSDNKRILSGGNDDQVIIHDVEKKCAVEVLPHSRAVCGLTLDPLNDQIIATAGNDGRLLLFDLRLSSDESLVIAKSVKAFHAVYFHPLQNGLLASANARDGAALWDIRTPKQPVVRYAGVNGISQNCMSVRFNRAGNRILALRRRLPPVLYKVDAAEPCAEFYHPDYYNSCTMKSCSFAGDRDQFVLSGSDDFGLYMWRIPDSDDSVVDPPHMILNGHRSIVNQVRYNKQFGVIASSGVEKIIKLWSPIEYPNMRGTLTSEVPNPDNPREVFSHEDYVTLVHHSGQFIPNTTSEQSTNEDPRMMAFFDSLVRRELAGRGRDSDSDSSHSDRQFMNCTRNQRSSTRLARLLSRHGQCPPTSRGPPRYSMNRRYKIPPRGIAPKLKKSASASVKMSMVAALKGKRNNMTSASSERTDSDEPSSHYSRTGKIIRPLRRRMNLSRSTKRKSRPTTSISVRRTDTRNGNMNANGDIQPSTSSGHRAALFRIAESSREYEGETTTTGEWEEGGMFSSSSSPRRHTADSDPDSSSRSTTPLPYLS